MRCTTRAHTYAGIDQRTRACAARTRTHPCALRAAAHQNPPAPHTTVRCNTQPSTAAITCAHLWSTTAPSGAPVAGMLIITCLLSSLLSPLHQPCRSNLLHISRVLMRPFSKAEIQSGLYTPVLEM